MTIYHWMIFALWLVFIAVWTVSSHSAKPNVGGRWVWRREIGLRLAIGVLIIIALRFLGLNPALRAAHIHWFNRSAELGVLGVALCALGVGLAVWARVHLGRNWGIPMAQKQNPELVTTGPYAYVRNPIYGGMLLAMLGTAIGLTMVWLIPFALGAVYFVIAARSKERLLAAQFPEQYPAYRARTKRFLPFLL